MLNGMVPKFISKCSELSVEFCFGRAMGLFRMSDEIVRRVTLDVPVVISERC